MTSLRIPIDKEAEKESLKQMLDRYFAPREDFKEKERCVLVLWV